MKKFLNNIYPYFYDIKTAFLIGVLILVLSTSFSFLFEPFDVNYNELKYPYFIIATIHATVSFLIFMMVVFILNKKREKEEDWKVKHELFLLLTILFLIGVVQFLIRDFIYEKDDNWSFRYLYEEIRNTLLVGGLLIFVITSINIERLKNSYSKRAGKVKIDIKPDVKCVGELEIITQVKSDDFILNVHNLNFAKSDKNYVELYLQNHDVLVKRMTIKSLENQLSNYNFILKTHRSFIVNLKSVKTVKGNTQGYKLLLNNSDHTVPVSRNMLAVFEESINNINA